MPRQLVEKEVGIVWKASFPHASSPFFSLLRKPAGQSPADCRYEDLCAWRVPPQAIPSNSAAGRWRSHRIREADRKRGLEDGGQACLQSRFQTLFHIACRYKSTKRLAFGMGLGRGFGLPKPPSQRLPSPVYHFKNSSTTGTTQPGLITGNSITSKSSASVRPSLKCITSRSENFNSLASCKNCA